MTAHLTTASWVTFFEMLSVNKSCLDQFVKMSDQKEDLKEQMSCEYHIYFTRV